MALGRMEHSWRVRSESKQKATVSPRRALANVTVDTVVHSPEALRFLVASFGEGNVVVGTDFPADMGLARPTAFVRETFADASELAERILSGNARRLLGARVGLSA
jgi:aminocarboxymuconate-semialdehyde decarboxylase